MRRSSIFLIPVAVWLVWGVALVVLDCGGNGETYKVPHRAPPTATATPNGEVYMFLPVPMTSPTKRASPPPCNAVSAAPCTPTRAPLAATKLIITWSKSRTPTPISTIPIGQRLTPTPTPKVIRTIPLGGPSPTATKLPLHSRVDVLETRAAIENR